ncbi:hypothetical protein VVR46_13045, partial [Corynebacterium phoceense]|uniref:hypothetical protein n=1 Tax=Corynebacterium phoceense TaxID=1686286 RepID=UPI0034CD6E1E
TLQAQTPPCGAWAYSRFSPRLSVVTVLSFKSHARRPGASDFEEGQAHAIGYSDADRNAGARATASEK